MAKTFFTLPFLLCDQLKGLLIEKGYGERINFYKLSTASVFKEFIEQFLPATDIKNNPYIKNNLNKRIPPEYADWCQYFVMDIEMNEEGEISNIRVYDVNWPSIRLLFFNALMKQGYLIREPRVCSLLDCVHYSGLFSETFNYISREEVCMSDFLREKTITIL